MTVKTAGSADLVDFEGWTQRRHVPSMGTNSGAKALPFQQWRHFKEAFAPELVARAVRESPIPVRRCIDPFGGSGTTSLACQFLGVHPLTIEVNPYLADLIEAKLSVYDADQVIRDLRRVLRHSRRSRARLELPEAAPTTLVQPGKDGRWIFDQSIARRLGALLSAIDDLEEDRNRKLLRVLLAGILIDVSNVIVNGKGRRYRQRWQERRRKPEHVEQYFSAAVERAVADIRRFSSRAHNGFTVIRGDARSRLKGLGQCDVAVFSPPYPNSFDYTDVYNIELWLLGYLQERSSNRALRQSTLCSHVQIDRPYPDAPSGSRTLDRVVRKLLDARSRMWHLRIPEMIGGYFADLMEVFDGLRSILHPKATIWLVVGDSQYVDVRIPTGKIIQELTKSVGFKALTVEPFRSMRASAQQGGRAELSESLLVLTRS